MDNKFSLLKEICEKSRLGFSPEGGVKTKSPRQTFANMQSDLIPLQQYINEQREFETKKCSHILCGDTRNSCVILGVALRLFKPSVVYEIGRYHGWSTTQIAFNLRNNFEKTGEKAKFISVDPHVGADGGPGWDVGLNRIGKQCGGLTEWDTSRDNINRAGVGDFVTPVQAFSGEYVKDVNDEIDFVFIDGDHTYEGAKSDINLYGAKMKSNGICILHDVWGEGINHGNYGPCKAYTEVNLDVWEKVGFTWDVGILRKK